MSEKENKENQVKETAGTKGMILLNELSLFVYESIQKGQTEEEILSHILDEYDVEIPQAAADLGEIISEFTKLGIIK